MAPPDDLYSANDDLEDGSDVESFSEELSPSDGFFNRQHMPAGLVPDPSQSQRARDEKTTEDKVLIAPGRDPRADPFAPSRSTTSTLAQLYPDSPEQAHASPSQLPNSPPHISMSPPSNTLASPKSPTRPSTYPEPSRMGAPPPAYTPSPVSHITQESTYHNSYMNSQPEQGHFQHPEPESMGAPAESVDPDENTPLTGGSQKKRLSPSRAIVKKLLFVALVIAVLVGLMTTILNMKTPTRDESDKTPISDPNRGTNSTYPSEPSDGNHCPSATYSEEDSVFELALGGDVGFQQITHGGEGRVQITTAGEVKIRRLPSGSDYKPHFRLGVKVTDPKLEVRKVWDQTTGALRISTPRYTSLPLLSHHCISLDVTIWLPEEANIRHLEVGVLSLGVRVLPDTSVNVSDEAALVSLSGDISFPSPPVAKDFKFASRIIDIETVSGTISGAYPVYDHLGLYSQSGSIHVTLTPQESDSENPKAAELEIKTSSGSIDVEAPYLDASDSSKYLPPARNYVTYVRSVSGDIFGAFYVGSVGEFKSTSSTIDLTVLPVIDASKDNEMKTCFSTRTESGSTRIEMLEPIFMTLVDGQHSLPGPYEPIDDGDPLGMFPPIPIFSKEPSVVSRQQMLRGVEAEHLSTSGSISLFYFAGHEIIPSRSRHHVISVPGHLPQAIRFPGLELILRQPPAFEGTILGKSISGSVKISGKDVKTIRSKSSWAKQEVLAGKGVDREGEGSSVVMKTVAASLAFTITGGQ